MASPRMPSSSGMRPEASSFECDKVGARVSEQRIYTIPAEADFFHGHQHLRPLHHRHRPFELPHRGTHAGGPPLRREPGAGGPAGGRLPGAGGALRFPRLDRPRPRHGPRRAHGARGGVAGGGRSRQRGASGGGHPRQRADRPPRPARDPLPRGGRPDLQSPGPPPPALERHALHRLRRGRGGAGRADLLLGGRRLRGQRGGHGGGPSHGGSHAAALSLPERRGAAEDQRGERPRHLGADAGEREGLAPGGGDPRRIAAHLGGHAALRRARLPADRSAPRGPQGAAAGPGPPPGARCPAPRTRSRTRSPCSTG